ncbi:flagellar basal body rod protein FlgB [Rossellomorea vietnamensis]|uniref:Flagellar basal body rod protein FlgB n=1 Tax=Rossellomorea vietnamensis TaxID=218284 RepID=A0A5D4MF60_9BACI|nr:flagellar basal body rod protein FlgB [Rossellomorea vietnamensis]TYS00128.1 flagellar basal body rod protein FlgB [Rossellomorea vietnamensis]
MNLFSNTIQSLENGLNYSSAKQKMISQNIANVDTPNYKAQSVSFKDQLSESISSMQAIRTNPKHFEFSSGGANGFALNAKPFQYNHNGNSVDIDKEMAEMANNQIYFNALSDRLNGKFNSMKTVISGGK